MNIKLNKKGQGIFDGIGGLAIGVGSLCIVLVVAFLIIAQATTNMKSAGGSQMCENASNTYYSGNDTCQSGSVVQGLSSAINSTRTLQTATATVPGWVSIIIITAIGALLIGMVAMFRR